MIGIPARPFAVITGGSSGTGFALAEQFLNNGFDILLAADTGAPEAASNLRATSQGAQISWLTADLSTTQGAETLHREIREIGRGVDVLAVHATIGLGQSFLDARREDWAKPLGTSIIGTLDLIHRVAGDMREAGHGRILIASSVATNPPRHLAIHSAAKAFLESFTIAIREELKGTGISITALLPGGAAKKDNAADIARAGYEALIPGNRHCGPGESRWEATHLPFQPHATFYTAHGEATHFS